MTAQLQASDLADPRLPRPGDVVAGKYRIDSFVARGGMGAVFAATHQVTGRRVALKWVLADARQDAEATHRVVREARAAARVRHPNVVDVYDVGEHDGSLFLVMELLEGETLHARLKAGGALDVPTTLALLLPALHAVEAAHANQVIHRDLKPSNIFLCRDAAGGEITPRVVDFGISKILAASGDGERSLTRSGAVLGTPHYMAPEQLTGHDADARTDVYALGVMLYQCLSGQLPFKDSNYNALVLLIATATPEPLVKLAPHVPPTLAAVVMRAMARKAGDRFASVSALIAELLPFTTESGLAAFAPERGAPKVSRVWWAALAVCVLAAILAWANQPRAADTAAAVPPPPTSRALLIDAVPTASAPVPATGPVRHAPAATSSAVAMPEAIPEPPPDAPRERTRPRRATRAQEGRALNATATPVAEPASAPKQPVSISLEQF